MVRLSGRTVLQLGPKGRSLLSLDSFGISGLPVNDGDRVTVEPLGQRAPAAVGRIQGSSSAWWPAGLRLAGWDQVEAID